MLLRYNFNLNNQVELLAAVWLKREASKVRMATTAMVSRPRPTQAARASRHYSEFLKMQNLLDFKGLRSLHTHFDGMSQKRQTRKRSNDDLPQNQIKTNNIRIGGKNTGHAYSEAGVLVPPSAVTSIGFAIWSKDCSILPAKPTTTHNRKQTTTTTTFTSNNNNNQQGSMVALVLELKPL
ncbi:hypothetical protein Tco_0116858 [Tanacetum coccineum]